MKKGVYIMRDARRLPPRLQRITRQQSRQHLGRTHGGGSLRPAGAPEGCRGLQRAAEGCRGLQRAPEVCRGLQRAAEGCRGLQRAAEGSRGLQRAPEAAFAASSQRLVPRAAPELRAASGNQPLGLHWTATQALLST